MWRVRSVSEISALLLGMRGRRVTYPVGPPDDLLCADALLPLASDSGEGLPPC